MIPRKVMYEHDEGLIYDHFVNDIVKDDRYLRFGLMMGEEAISDYISKSLSHFGIYNMWFVVEDIGSVIATVHINIDDSKRAEMGFTVAPQYRGKGICQNLFQRGATWAAMKGATSIYTHCLSENKTMQHIAKKNGMAVVTIDAGEKEATIKVDKYVTQAYYEDKFMDGIAFVDYAINKQANIITSLMRL